MGRDSSATPGADGRGGRAWTLWLQQATTLVYLVGGVFLLFLYRQRMRRGTVLATGILFVLYSVYRCFLVRRSARRQRRPFGGLSRHKEPNSAKE